MTTRRAERYLSFLYERIKPMPSLWFGDKKRTELEKFLKAAKRNRNHIPIVMN